MVPGIALGTGLGVGVMPAGTGAVTPCGDNETGDADGDGGELVAGGGGST